ncbi:hypothetical protein BSN85_36410 [Bradyrhizobium brasilense]|uniref:class I SAM-dependent methyltransferase n=1 Tax=Bradyrhizobium brasilense TaxID=1419277 RepID=UPI00097794FD|nr:class I SAM-dependent methyltransferase [Bradyrhizobium brasilense]OMH99540.1 hypothetical protein BSN85_36410 [Bradyrhizobium brasilense]
MKEVGFKSVSGHEIPGHAEAAKQHADVVYEDYDQSTIPAASFDAVVMIDVMEHVPSPIATLQRVHAVLRPGGTLYFHSPRVSALDRTMHAIGGPLGRAWQHSRTSVFHLQNYSEKGLKLALSKTGFAVKEIEARNELTCPVSMYVEGYVRGPARLPKAATPIVAAGLTPLVRGPMNRNKAVVTAIRG